MDSMQGICGSQLSAPTTNVDFVFVIDATQSMAPVINRVKDMALSFHELLTAGLKEHNKKINQLRIKIIAFRDYYCDGELAMEESDFFYFPEEAEQFRTCVSKIQAKGGGDAPESALEALSLAMRSDWEEEGSSKRHIIVLFTDAPAHPLEQQVDGIPKNYPANMFKTYAEMLDAWGVGQDTCMDDSLGRFKMNSNAERLVLFAPDLEPWPTIKREFKLCTGQSIEADGGGSDLGMQDIIRMLSSSVR